MTLTNKPLILVDGSSYLYRAFHALPSLANSKGFPTGAIYGVVNMLQKLIKDYDPIYMAVIFDSKGKTFRDDLYDKYKANRPAMPEELSQQFPSLYKVIEALGLPLIMIEGVEADDIIGTIAKQQQGDVLISTGDKDLAQLVDSNITLINTMTNSVLTPQLVQEKFGIPPSLIIDYLSLVGDTVDNIPGVPQVGPKTAVKWLQEYGSLDNIIKNASDVKTKAGDNLRACLDQLPLARQLATIKLDLDLNLKLEDLKRKAPNQALLINLFQELEFRTWLNDLLSKEPVQEINRDYHTIFTEEAFEHTLEQLKQADIISLNIETVAPDSLELVGISFSTKKNHGVYIPFTHDYIGAPSQLSKEEVLKKIKPLLENEEIKKVGHHLKQAMKVLFHYHIQLTCSYDAMLESYILDSSSNRYDLYSLALKFLGKKTIQQEEIVGKGMKQISFAEVPIETALSYAAEKADIALQLHQHLWDRLVNEPGLKSVFETIEMPLIPVLAKMEYEGVLIDSNMLLKQNEDLEYRVTLLEKEAFTLAGKNFNLNSPKQLQDVLFNDLKLPVLQKTPTGQPSTADAVLQELAHDFALPKIIIEQRSLCKLISTYTKKLPEQINSKTHRIHTSYNQSGTATGRLSSSDPNLQNIPIRTIEGKHIRQTFIAPKGFKIISADYSQIELRIMAHITDDPNLLKAFKHNLDIHEATAAEILQINIEEVTSEQRRSAKAINFGLIYGMSSFGLAKQIGADRQTAQEYIDLYFERYPNIKEYMEKTRALARQQGYVETLWGRRLYLPDIRSSQMMRQKAAERTAINAPLQGSAADIIKKAMINIDHHLKSNHSKTKMIMQVHDELVFEVPDDDVEEIKNIICEHMMHAVELKVPLLVSIGSGNNWDEAAS